MKKYEREIDELGRVKIPNEVMAQMNIRPKTMVGLALLDDVIVVIPNSGVCTLCGEPIPAKTKFALCGGCITRIKNDGEDITAKPNSTTQRTVDELGRLVLPAEFRRALNIGKTGAVMFEIEEDRIKLKPVVRSCTQCGAVIPVGKKYRLCDNCLQKIKALSGHYIAKMKHKQGRFYIGNISFSLPNNTYVTSVTEIEIENGIGIVSDDEKVVVMIMGNDYAESAKESIESIFDSETGYEKVGEIEEVTLAEFNGYKVMYQDQRSVNIECCFDVNQDSDVVTLTVWAKTDRVLGEEAIVKMKALLDAVIADVRVDV